MALRVGMMQVSPYTRRVEVYGAESEVVEETPDLRFFEEEVEGDANVVESSDGE